MLLSKISAVPRLVSIAGRQSVRCCSTAGKLVNVDINPDSGIATVTMNRPPVNSLNLELVSDLVDAMGAVKKNKCLGMILTSSSPTVFSAGLDIMEMYQPSEERLKKFWYTLQVRMGREFAGTQKDLNLECDSFRKLGCNCTVRDFPRLLLSMVTPPQEAASLL